MVSLICGSKKKILFKDELIKTESGKVVAKGWVMWETGTGWQKRANFQL